jgi:hypothetical protein
MPLRVVKFTRRRVWQADELDEEIARLSRNMRHRSGGPARSLNVRWAIAAARRLSSAR